MVHPGRLESGSWVGFLEVPEVKVLGGFLKVSQRSRVLFAIEGCAACTDAMSCRRVAPQFGCGSKIS